MEILSVNIMLFSPLSFLLWSNVICKYNAQAKKKTSAYKSHYKYKCGISKSKSRRKRTLKAEVYGFSTPFIEMTDIKSETFLFQHFYLNAKPSGCWKLSMSQEQ